MHVWWCGVPRFRRHTLFLPHGGRRWEVYSTTFPIRCQLVVGCGCRAPSGSLLAGQALSSIAFRCACDLLRYAVSLSGWPLLRSVRVQWGAVVVIFHDAMPFVPAIPVFVQAMSAAWQFLSPAAFGIAAVCAFGVVLVCSRCKAVQVRGDCLWCGAGGRLPGMAAQTKCFSMNKLNT